MFQNDWFMREIENLSASISEVVFHKQHPKLEISEEQHSFDRDMLWNELMTHVKKGEINFAENLLFNNIGEVSFDISSMASEFYEYLDSLNDDFLTENDFSREEIKQGSEDFAVAFKIQSQLSNY